MTITTVNNGTTTKQVDTTDMNIATYNVQLNYNGNNTYNSQNTNTTLSITAHTGKKHIVNTKTTDEWVYTDEARKNILATTPTINNNGIETGTYRYLTCTTPIQYNTRIKLSAIATTTTNTVPFQITNQITNDTWNSYLYHDSSSTTNFGQNINGTDTHIQIPNLTTRYTLYYTITPDELILEYNDNTYNIENKLPYNKTNQFYAALRKWGGGGITVTELEFETI